MESKLQLITLLGPTAVGKTRLAARIAYAVGGEIISADSRQVFSRMDIGTGKDLSDYKIGDTCIPFHLIDIAEPGTEFSVFNFKEHFLNTYYDIVSRLKVPVMCGGTGLYLDSVLRGYRMEKVPVSNELHSKLSLLSMDELTHILESYKTLHNTTDTETRERLQRAIEIEMHRSSTGNDTRFPDFTKTPVFGLRLSRQLNRERITQRLHERLQNGMIDEVKQLLDEGVSAFQLKKYGLEYKYLTMYLLGELSFDKMAGLLETAIHQFAKRQMTWFRKMERSGIVIHWLEGEKGIENNLNEVLSILRSLGYMH